jgi:hypothetical protein
MFVPIWMIVVAGVVLVGPFAARGLLALLQAVLGPGEQRAFEAKMTANKEAAATQAKRAAEEWAALPEDEKRRRWAESTAAREKQSKLELERDLRSYR